MFTTHPKRRFRGVERSPRAAKTGTPPDSRCPDFIALCKHAELAAAFKGCFPHLPKNKPPRRSWKASRKFLFLFPQFYSPDLRFDPISIAARQKTDLVTPPDPYT